MTARLATGLWVSAYLARLNQQGIFAHVMHRGDKTAGAIAVKLAFMNGHATLFTRRYDLDGRVVWEETHKEAPEAELDQVVARQRGFDRDLWVIEVEDPHGRHLLDAEGI